MDPSSCEQELCVPISLLYFLRTLSCEQELCQPMSLSLERALSSEIWLTRPLLGSLRCGSVATLYATLQSRVTCDYLTWSKVWIIRRTGFGKLITVWSEIGSTYINAVTSLASCGTYEHTRLPVCNIITCGSASFF